MGFGLDIFMHILYIMYKGSRIAKRNNKIKINVSPIILKAIREFFKDHPVLYLFN